MIVFNGKEASELGLNVVPFSLRKIPQKNHTFVNVLGKEEPIIVKSGGAVPVQIDIEADLTDKSRFDEVNAWLTGRGLLVDDEEPDKYRIAEVLDGTTLTSVNDDITTLTWAFMCSAYMYAVNPTVVDISDATVYKQLDYKGTVEGAPKIRFKSNSHDPITFTVNGVDFTVTLPDVCVTYVLPVVIDTEHQIMYYEWIEERHAITQYSTGDFPLLHADGTANYIKFSGSVVEATINLNERWY